METFDDLNTGTPSVLKMNEILFPELRIPFLTKDLYSLCVFDVFLCLLLAVKPVLQVFIKAGS